MIDLSALQIPDVSVVPEPTDGELKVFTRAGSRTTAYPVWIIGSVKDG